MAAFRILRKAASEKSDMEYIPKIVPLLAHVFSSVELFLLKNLNFRLNFLVLGYVGLLENKNKFHLDASYSFACSKSSEFY
jgi:hypothetical protein